MQPLRGANTAPALCGALEGCSAAPIAAKRRFPDYYTGPYTGPAYSPEIATRTRTPLMVKTAAEDLFTASQCHRPLNVPGAATRVQCSLLSALAGIPAACSGKSAHVRFVRACSYH